MELFDKLVAPILNYGSEVWGFCKANQIEKVHLQFCKHLLGVKNSTQNDLIYSELGRKPMQVIRYQRIIKFWFKILNSEDTKLIKCIYRQLLQDIQNDPNKTNWASLVQTLLSTLGFHEVWLSQGVGNEQLFLNEFKQRLADSHMQNLHDRISNSPKARFYSMFYSFGFKSYLEQVTVIKFRTAITKLRLSSHRLAVETGRFNRPVATPLNERKCTLCNTLEDEFHFLFECSLYRNLRKTFLPRSFWKRRNIPNAIHLMTSESPNINLKLGQYIYKAFKLHSQYASIM